MKKYATKVLVAALSTAVIAGMSVMPVFAQVSVTNGPWIGSDATVDAETGEVTAAGTAIQTKKTITVTDVNDDVSGRVVTAYQLVKGTYKDGKLTGYVLCDPTKASLADMEKPKADEITAIANLIQSADPDDQPDLKGIVMTKGNTQDTAGQYTAQVEAGLYLVLVTGADTVVYNPALVAVNISNANLLTLSDDGRDTVAMSGFFAYPQNAYLKSSQSGFDKKIVTQGTKSAKGDTAAYEDAVNYKIDSMTIPSYSADYVSPVEYKVTDQLDTDGFIGVDELTVKTGVDTDNLAVLAASVDDDNDDQTPDATNYTVVYKDKTGAATENTDEAVAFEVSFDEAFIRAHATYAVEITYSTTLKSGAKVNYYEHKNTAQLSYSNDATDANSRKTLSATTYHYTFGIDASVDAGSDGDFTTFELNKVNSSEGTFTNGVNSAALEGAEFTLYSDAEMTNVVTTASTNTDTNGVATSDNDGHLTFKGLDEGTYYLKETNAPDGYTLNGNDYRIVIAATVDDTTGVMTGYSVTTSVKNTSGEYEDVGSCTYTNDLTSDDFGIDENGNVTNVITAAADNTPVLILNTSLAVLPATGGIGTIIITSCAAVGMALFLTLFIVTRRKKSSDEDTE